MYTHKKSIIIDHNIITAYNLVANITDYPNFIPWISSTKQIFCNNSTPLVCHYLVEVDFKVTKETFTTKDTFYPNQKIVVELLNGPFKHLYSTWTFTKLTEQTTQVDFFIEFDFKSKLLSAAFGKIFLVAQQKILTYFINQINQQPKE